MVLTVAIKNRKYKLNNIRNEKSTDRTPSAETTDSVFGLGEGEYSVAITDFYKRLIEHVKKSTKSLILFAFYLADKARTSRY